ncbi:MAG: glycoside hydrolase family 13 protein [Chloroflexota bacterium]
MTDFQTPEWVKDAVFYQIFPDRFARSDRVAKPANLEPWNSPPTVYGFKGGDLLGIAERLDYLDDLGITAIYLTPIFQSAANHRYHTYDYYRVDPILGGDGAFHHFLDAAHARGMRVVLDGVFNHASRGFYQFYHTLENGEASPYRDWFIFDEQCLQDGGRPNAYPGPGDQDASRGAAGSLDAYGYKAWWDLPALPEFNTHNPEVRAYLFDVARYWLDQGVDGWRLDVPQCIDDDAFWREFRSVVKDANPDAYIVGEISSDATRWLQGDQFDAVMNYLFTQACLGFFGGEGLDAGLLSAPLFRGVSPLETPAFARTVADLLQRYPRQAALAQLNLLDSHDTPRFLTLVRGDEAALRLAVLFQMTYPGAPCVYYGDEIGLEGGPDPDCRRSFPWDESRWRHDLRDFVRRCIALRRAHPALRRGAFTTLYAEDGIFVYLRSLDDERLIVALNNGPATHHLAVPASQYLSDGDHLRALIGDGAATVVGGQLVGPAIPPYTAAVLALEEGAPS